MASKPIPSGPSSVPSTRPVSSLGRKPFGIATNSHTVAPSVRKLNTIVAGRCCITQPSDRT